jgi:hypothetical protein
MKKVSEVKTVEGDASGGQQIVAYAQGQPPAFRTICDVLRGLIDAAFPKATFKVWHGSPVWFIEGNPVVGYSVTANSVSLLFWNGRAFYEPYLKPVGKYRAAQVVFEHAAEIDPEAIRRWLRKARSAVLDSKAFFKKLREGN